MLALYLELIGDSDSCHVPESLDLNDGNDVKGQDPFVFDAMLLPDFRLFLEVPQSNVVIGCIAGHTGDNPCSLVHLDGHEGQGVNAFMLATGRLHSCANKVLPLDLQQTFWLTMNLTRTKCFESLMSGTKTWLKVTGMLSLCWMEYEKGQTGACTLVDSRSSHFQSTLMHTPAPSNPTHQALKVLGASAY